jgi:hypothetical protein
MFSPFSVQSDEMNAEESSSTLADRCFSAGVGKQYLLPYLLRTELSARSE